MKRLFILGMVVVGVVLQVKACDICGCSMNSNFYGIMPNYKKHFIGTRYKYSSFTSSHPDQTTFGKDYFHNIEIWGRYVPHSKIHLFAFVPFSFNTRTEQDDYWKINALGDISLMANYILYNDSDSAVQWRKFIHIGGGVKLPTGSNGVIQNNHTIPVVLQPGTGSTDFLLNAVCALRYNKVGVNVDLNERINTQNAKSYRYGNRFGASVRFFYWSLIRFTSVVPHLGIDVEYGQQDVSKGKDVDFTGGYAVLGNVGINIFHGRWSFGASIQPVIKQQLNQGQTQRNTTLSAQFLYFL